jgi:medium-chain acyl-[acyl-carrier-protein] hydrolase
MIDTRDWFVPLASDGGDLRVFGFPHAGAGCAQLVDLARALVPHGLTMWSVNLPGRQARLDEPPRAGLHPLTEELADAITPYLEQPYALFGYCGGALLAFMLVRTLRARSAPLPRQLVVASAEAPDIALRPRRVANLPSDTLWAYLEESGSMPASLGAEGRLRQVVEPAIRADFALLAGYRHQPDLPLPVPVTVCYGSRGHIPRGALLGWRRQSSWPVTLCEVDGGHWLLDDARGQLAAALGAVLSDGRP